MKKILLLIYIFFISTFIVATIPLAWTLNFIGIDDQPVGYETLFFDSLYLDQHSFILAYDTTNPAESIPWAVTDYLPKGWYSKINLEFYQLPNSPKNHLEKNTRLTFTIVRDNGDTFYLRETDTIVSAYDQPYQKTITLY